MISLSEMQLLTDISTCCASAGVFTRPRPISDIHPRRALCACTSSPRGTSPCRPGRRRRR